MVTHRKHSQGHPKAQQKNAYQAFYEQTSPVMGHSGAMEEHDDDDIATGVAMDTRNYQEMIKQATPAVALPVQSAGQSSGAAARGKSDHSSNSRSHKSSKKSDSNELRRRSSQPTGSPPPRFSVLLGSNNPHNYNSSNQNDPAILGEMVHEGKDEDVQGIDKTVRGLAIDTRNYQALVGNSSEDFPTALTARPAKQPASQPAAKPRFPIKHADSSNNTDEDEAADTVYGLPIATGNYAAFVGAGAKVKSRARGYSDQAGVGERRVSAPGFTNPRSPMQYATAPAAPPNDADQQRTSCFETRRATTVAVVPYSGWLYIQGSTFKTWKKQYAVLSGLEFKYSKGPGHSPKGFDTVLAAQQWNGMAHGMNLVLSSGKQLPVHCENATEYDNWMRAFQKSLDKLQHLSGHSKTSYTVTASEQHEGYLFKQEPRAAGWRRHYFVARIDGYIECKVTEDASSIDGRNSGYIMSVSFADVHPNGIAIQLDSGASVLVYADTYDERMLWYAAMSSAALANDRTPHATASSVKSTYVQTARANHAGWMHKQAGLFKSWKRFYFTMHGSEMSFSKDANSSVVLCDKIQSIEDWSGKQNGLQIRLKSGRIWKVYADSYDSAKRWRTLIMNATRQGGDNFNAKRYLASRKRKGLSPVFGGWLTNVKDNGMKLRQFYVVDGNKMGFASEVDHQLQQIGRVVDVGASRDLSCGIVVTFATGAKLKLAVDSIETHKSWYEILKASL